MQIQEKQMVVNNLLTTYYVADGSGPTLVFLHGWGSNSTFWFKATEQLAVKGCALYFIDLPGFGKTEMPEEPFTTVRYAEFVESCVNKLSIEQYTLVGHSFGGKVAVKIGSIAHSERLVSLVLVDSSGLPHASIMTKLKSKAAHTLKPLFTPPFMQRTRNKLLRLFGSDDYVAEPRLRQTFINIIQEHVTFDLPNIKVPTLIVWGSDDDNEYSPPGDAHIFHTQIQNSELYMIDGAKHYSFMDNPDAFQKKVLQFINHVYGKD